MAVKFCKPCEFEVDGRLGETGVSFSNKTATVKILREDLRPAGSATTQAILIHELLHLHVEPLIIEEGQVRRNAIERAVESIATGMEALATAKASLAAKPKKVKR